MANTNEAAIAAVEKRVAVLRPDVLPAVRKELTEIAIDRICPRLQEETLRGEFYSVTVEIVCALINRIDAEGQTGESVEGFSRNFPLDLFEAYEADFALYLYEKDKQNDGKAGKVVFL